jgi:hypothetical protein
MKIELFLETIDQEEIRVEKYAPEPPTPVPPGGPPCKLYVSWKKQCCVLNCVRTTERRGHKPIVSARKTSVIFMRKEIDGGLIWDSKSGAVYKVDVEAYQALNDLDAGLPPKKVVKCMGLTSSKFNKFLDEVRKLDK